MIDRVLHDSGSVDSANLILAPVTLNVGETVTRTHSFVILATDAVAPPHFLADENRVSGVDLGTTLPFTLTFQALIRVLRPAIDVTKVCQFVGTPDNPLVSFTFSVTNTGDTTLFTVTVVDDNGTPGNTADDVTFPIPDLAPGEGRSVTSTYVATVNPSINTVTAKGFDILGLTDPAGDTVQNRGRVTDTANCTVNIPCNPAIDVNKTCVVVGSVGSFVVNYSGRVTNTGNVTLTGVTVVDDKGGAPISIGTIPPGESRPYSGSYALPANTQCSANVSDTVTATGTFASICPPVGGVRTVTDTANATCTTPPCAPDIEVTKEIACYLPGDTCGTYAKVATGVRNGECPAFCYRITVQNANNGVTITTLTVNDTLLGNISGLFASALPLVPGESVTVEIKGVEVCADIRNTVTANGQSADAQSDVDTDFADAVVLNINLVCDLTLFSSVDLDENPDNNSVVLPVGSVDAPVQFNLVLRNTGSSPITVTNITGLPALVNCDDLTTPVVVALPFDIDPGQSLELNACVLVSCPGAQFSVQAHGVASDEGGTLCVFDENGVRVSDSTDLCPAVVTCEQPVTCRVTGGGVLLPGTSDESCITVNTTIFPLQTAGGLVINKITHGGQLGAPFSQEDCGEILGNPCIRGQWQHVRHYQGTGNPRDVIDMNFHSVTPKGVFDSLNCACLGCCDPETGVFINPITVGSLCNPDDRKVCGPQPRPAPANAIIFSGVGRITPADDVRGSRAALAEWVVFRVYIEDRSEPGGFHPKGAIEPADIYCFQAWKTGIKVTKKPDFATVAETFRRALGEANCDFLADLQDGTLPIGTLPPPTVNGVTADIQDCGPMSTGNHQIHPSTSATCTE